MSFANGRILFNSLALFEIVLFPALPKMRTLSSVNTEYTPNQKARFCLAVVFIVYIIGIPSKRIKGDYRSIPDRRRMGYRFFGQGKFQSS